MNNEAAAAPTRSFDLVVVGAGGAGLAAALLGAVEGLQVLLVEATEYVGGTTAYSGGTTWIPNTHLAATVGADDSVERARGYLERVIGSYVNRPLLDAFLAQGPRAIRRLEDETEVRFRAFPSHPDYQSDVEGATARGRALEPLPFDGRLLGDAFALVRPPIPEFTVLGGMMVDRTDINHLLRMTRSWASFRHAARILARHARDRVRHPRGTRLVMGNALVARLLHSLRKRNVPIWTGARVESLQPADEGMSVIVACKGSRQSVHARRGVVLASGGFNRNAVIRERLLGRDAPYSPVAPGNTGGMIDLARGLDAAFKTDNFDHVLWAPVSARKRADGSTAVFPHFIMDRGKPGTVVVNQRGQRFLNETTSYHLFGHAMVEANRDTPCIPAYLIADRRALTAYGLGMIRPGARDLAAFIADGYVVEAPTIEALAGKLGIDPARVRATVEDMKGYAATGVDTAFGRGSTLYQRNLGDPAHQPNPTLGAIEAPPFYAVRLYPGDIGASSGLATDEHARVLRTDGHPIAGLYAVGNDMSSVMGGTYPGPGITLGPSIAFAYAAVRHAAAATQGTPERHDVIAG